MTSRRSCLALAIDRDINGDASRVGTGLRKRTTGLMVREVQDEILLLDTVADRVHKLNPTATVIWRECCVAASPAEIALKLASLYEVDQHSALKDVNDTLEQFRTLGLILTEEDAE
jgi:hypothetical protein